LTDIFCGGGAAKKMPPILPNNYICAEKNPDPFRETWTLFFTITPFSVNE
jgi:hypothetical protein